MLERSPAAKSAISVLYESFNDVDVYIEDTADGYEKIFAKLLTRSLGGIVSIDRVFPLGPRLSVISQAKVEQEAKSGRKSIFIVDGDLYLICGEFEPIPNNVLVLPRYCVENFIFDQQSILEVLDEEDSRHDFDYLAGKFEYEDWLSSANATLKPLFVIFAVSHHLKSGIKTVRRGSKSFCKDDYGNVDEAKVRFAYNEIYNDLTHTFGKYTVDELINKFTSNIAREKCFVSTYVSGKDFILPLLFLRIKAISKTKTPNLNLKIRLANKCSVNPLRGVAARISQIAKS